MRRYSNKKHHLSSARPRPVAFRLTAMSLAVAAIYSLSVPLEAAQPGQILPPGTLPQLRALFPQGVSSATTQTGTGQSMVINQTIQKAIIDWNSFNIARGSSVQFVQPNAGASALNRIHDLDPTVIQGQLSANGQVILINQNGIMFDRGSQVNVRSLIASTLNITDDIFNFGLATGSDPAALQFEGVTGFTKIDIGSNGPAGAAPAMLTASQGGSIIILAPNIVNNGIIKAPDGQVILAAGHKVLLFQPSDQNSAQIRGYFVQVSADKDPVNLTSVVTNLGSIEADRGNVTLAGLTVNQMNRITAKTAINRNGSIWLIGQDKVTLGKQSVTGTPLDTSDKTTLADDQDYSAFRASVKVEANTIVHQGSIISPSGVVSMQTFSAAATDANNNSSVIASGDTSNSGPTRIFLDQGSVIDVSGNWADVPIDKNLVSVRITSNDLKDSPVQKGGALLGKTVTVDTRVGTPLFDASGYSGAIPRTIGEKATFGGDVSLLSQGDMIIQGGAVLDVSGGGYRYSGGAVATTSLLGSDGKVYDIGRAPKDLTYLSVYNGQSTKVYQKYGVTEVFSGMQSLPPRVEPAYVEGKAAGSITLDAHSIVQNGTLRSLTTAGRNQIVAGKQPATGELTIGLGDTTRALQFLLNQITLGAGAQALPEAFSPLDALPVDRVGVLALSSRVLSAKASASSDQYAQDGFGSITLGANQKIVLPENTTLNLALGASLAMTASEIDVGGTITAPGGSVSLKAVNTGFNGGPQEVAVGSRAVISTAGSWINDRQAAIANSSGTLSPLFLQGGKISLSSEFAVDLAAGSVLNASGGAQLTQAGKIVAGDAGSITLQAGAGSSDLFDGRLSLGGSLIAYSAAKGGSLSLSAPAFVIGAAATDPRSVSLDPSYFQQGGFSQFTLKGYYGVTLASGTVLAPSTRNLVIDQAAAASRISGSDLLAFSRQVQLPDAQRTPTNLSLSVTANHLVTGAALTLEEGSTVRLFPGGAFSGTSSAALNVFGTIETPGGSISLAETSDQPGPPALRLGSSARLLAQGAFVEQPNAQGLRLGTLLRGGTVTLTSAGSIAAEAGSIIDVSAISVPMSIATSSNSILGSITTLVNGDAGVVTISSAGTIALPEGTLRGSAAAGAAGGTLAIKLTLGNADGNPVRELILAGPGAAATAPGTGVLASTFDPADWSAAGFDKLILASPDRVVFDGNVALSAARSIEVSAPVYNVATGNAIIAAPRVTIDGPALNQSNQMKLAQFETSTGTGKLTVNAGLIDLVGGITVNGASKVQLNSSGDLRVTGLSVRLGEAANQDEASIPDSLAGYLVTPGDLQLTAQQIYPTTLSQFRFSVANVQRTNDGLVETPAPGGRIDIARVAGVPGAALSAGGSLSFSADTIASGGVVKAPLGSIAFHGASSVTLDGASETSVSGAGMVIPFGETVNGQSWTYGAIQNVSLNAKSIATDGPNVVIAPGAKLDVSGGGNVQAAEWVAGIGGSTDVLLANNVYAIVPSMRLAYAPVDKDLQSKKSLAFATPSGTYDAVFLPGGNGIPAGYYPLLPGYYALLPGAYKVTLNTGSAFANVLPGNTIALPGGGVVMAGKLAVSGTGIQSQTWSAISVESIAQVQRQAEYRLSDASFFANQATANDRVLPPLPRDAGRVSISATTGLQFEPTLVGTPAAGGNGARVDISAPRITVASADDASSGGGVRLNADALSALNASLLIGGTRSDTSNGEILNVGASTVTVVAGAVLRGPEVILAANDTVDVQAGATISGEGAFSGSANDLTVAGAGSAILRASSGNQINLARTGAVDRSQGTLKVGQGAVISASKSLLLDATKSTLSDGLLSVADGGFVSLGAGNIRIGDAPAIADSLSISNAQLGAFSKLDTIALRSYTSIDFYGNVDLGTDTVDPLTSERIRFNGITLDTAAINGNGGGTVNIRARNVTLQNATTTLTQSSRGVGTLNVAADRITLGTGSKSINGFKDIALGAQGDISGAGKGDLRAAGALTLESARVVGSLKSDQTIVAIAETASTDPNLNEAPNIYYKVSLKRPTDPLAASGVDTFGGKVAITGSAIDHAGTIELPAGSITLTAMGVDGIVLRSGSKLSATGATRSFGGTTSRAGGGTVNLVTAGALVAEAGSALDVSGAAAGGDAGTLAITTTNATAPFNLDGTINASAQSGYLQGSAVLDLAAAGNFSDLNAKLNLAGFSQSRNIRVRTGNVNIAGADASTQSSADVIIARHFKLSADQGDIVVAGSIDASGADGGGTIELDAMNNLVLTSGSMLLARGTSGSSGASDAYSHGGNVELASRSGSLSMEPGALIDVSANATGKSSGGKVLLSARRTTNDAGADSDVAMSLAGKVNLGGGATGGQAGSLTLEGVHGYDGITDTAIASNAGSAVMADYKSFVGNAQGIVTRVTSEGLVLEGADAASALHVSGGVELRSGGDMVLSSAWDLTSADWMLSGDPGRLTLRAAGSLIIQDALGFPSDSLATMRSWSIRLAGGADLSAADAMAVVTQSVRGVSGDVVLTNTDSNGVNIAGKVRTGTGSIKVAAARDIVFQDPPGDVPTQNGDPILTAPAAVIYTAGLARPDSTNPSLDTTPSGGGDVELSAGWNIVGAAKQQQWINDWMRRTTSNSDDVIESRPAGWFVSRANFRHNVGTLGGGNITVLAGNDVTNLSAMLPTTGRVISGTTSTTLDVEGGGNLRLHAGGNIDGGDFLVARGQGIMDAGGSIGATKGVGIYLMGQSSDPAKDGASVKVTSGGDLNVQNVSNPTLMLLNSVPGTGQGFGSHRSYFLTYSEKSAIELESVSGNIVLQGLAVSKLSKEAAADTSLDPAFSDFLPPNVSMTALQGGISGGHDFPTQASLMLYPSVNSSLNIVANANISNVAFNVVDVVPSIQNFWGWDRPAEAPNAESAVDSSKFILGATATLRYVTPSVGGERNFHVYSGGSIVDSAFSLPRQSEVSAKSDLRNVQLDLQNLSEADVTIVRAGRDIVYTGFYQNGTADADNGGGYIRIGGPGRQLVQAGRNIDLGTSKGIDAVGNNSNSSLPTSQSAALTVLAGVTGEINFAAIDTLFDDLKSAGTRQDAPAGQAAIDRVFGPQNTAHGSITMFFSQIRTQGDSGIDLLAPAGDINAGLPVSIVGRDIGISTTLGGDIRSYLSGDFNVNQSKVITLIGGDILIYTSQGNIDAGRGARDSRTTQAPRRVALLDSSNKPTGLFTFVPPVDASGSGIRSLTFDPDGPGPLTTPKPGDIFLFAPKGFIDAGEAGVSSAGNIFVAALQVLNASNISAGGTATGVPAAPGGGVSAALSGASSVAASAAKSAEDATRSLTSSGAVAPKETYRPSFISVEVLGIGDESSQKEDEKKK